MTDRSNTGAVGRAARVVTVDADSGNRRLDNFLISQLKGLPRPRIYRMIRSGEVRVNKGRARPSTRLVAGDQVRIPPASGLQGDARQPVSPNRANWILGHILHEDDHLLVINKPAGLAVHGGSGISLGAIELLRAARPESHYMELVHRLDRATSGCLLVAKKRSALRKLHEDFRAGKVAKHYLALLLGERLDEDCEVDLPLLVEHREGGERHVRPGPAGKPALTRFSPQQVCKGATLVNVQIMTGRTHQIRVHAAAIDRPVAGDKRYGDGLPGPAGLKRLFLHARRLELAHPADGARFDVTAPLDSDLEGVLRRLNREQA